MEDVCPIKGGLFDLIIMISGANDNLISMLI